MWANKYYKVTPLFTIALTRASIIKRQIFQEYDAVVIVTDHFFSHMMRLEYAMLNI